VTAGTTGTDADALEIEADAESMVVESIVVDPPVLVDQLEVSAEPPAQAARSSPVRRHKLLRQWPLVLVIAVIGVGLIVIAMHHFRWGSLAIASATVGAAFLRLVLPARRAGWLAVRSRLLDVVTTGSIGIALMVLALITRT
jgi:hypothetical protein